MPKCNADLFVETESKLPIQTAMQTLCGQCLELKAALKATVVIDANCLYTSSLTIVLQDDVMSTASSSVPSPLDNDVDYKPPAYLSKDLKPQETGIGPGAVSNSSVGQSQPLNPQPQYPASLALQPSVTSAEPSASSAKLELEQAGKETSDSESDSKTSSSEQESVEEQPQLQQQQPVASAAAAATLQSHAAQPQLGPVKSEPKEDVKTSAMEEKWEGNEGRESEGRPPHPVPPTVPDRIPELYRPGVPLLPQPGMFHPYGLPLQPHFQAAVKQESDRKVGGLPELQPETSQAAYPRDTSKLGTKPADAVPKAPTLLQGPPPLVSATSSTTTSTAALLPSMAPTASYPQPVVHIKQEIKQEPGEYSHSERPHSPRHSPHGSHMAPHSHPHPNPHPNLHLMPHSALTSSSQRHPHVMASHQNPHRTPNAHLHPSPHANPGSHSPHRRTPPPPSPSPQIATEVTTATEFTAEVKVTSEVKVKITCSVRERE